MVNRRGALVRVALAATCVISAACASDPSGSGDEGPNDADEAEVATTAAALTTGGYCLYTTVGNGKNAQKVLTGSCAGFNYFVMACLHQTSSACPAGATVIEAGTFQCGSGWRGVRNVDRARTCTVTGPG
jgi:hypothetical protein